MASLIGEERRLFHDHLLAEVLVRGAKGVLTNADKDSKPSCKIAAAIGEQLGGVKDGQRLQGQVAGRRFEEITCDYLRRTFLQIPHISADRWHIDRVMNKQGTEAIAAFNQYAHLSKLAAAAAADPTLAVSLGNNYVIAPDITIARLPSTVDELNADLDLIDPDSPSSATLLADRPTLHASISCKWTIRSDRSQNARSEGLNLTRNRKGRTPHIAVVTAEPLPSRLASVALGTGDIDCVYHFALYELLEAVQSLDRSAAADEAQMLVDGDRLKDISDLPLDLLV